MPMCRHTRYVRSPRARRCRVVETTMKSCMVAFLGAYLLTACSSKPAAPNAGFWKSSNPSRADTSGSAACSPLPSKVVLDFPHHLQADYYYVNVKNAIRHSVVMVYLRDDTATVDQHVSDAMLAAGFSLYDRRQEDHARTHLRFSRKGYGMAHVTLQPMTTAPPDDNAIVRGTMTFDLPPTQFNPPAKAK